MVRFGGGVDKYGMFFCMVYLWNIVVGKENVNIVG